MTSSNGGSVLKDVVAYVDVWSSDKTANYSKAFIQQLEEMGAQVSKTFNKQVTHVIFNNGHLATWRKAKKSHVKLVSVLWVGRCYEDRVHVDEELCPALNDESNPMLKNKKHRCMLPKDSPERTPENDRRMRKKLDKMMKGLPQKQPLVTDVSPIFIDEENKIVYSPALKRSDYMAQRLKDMKKKRENLSPTASQIVESCSPSGLKPSLGRSPTVFKLLYDQSDDDDSSASVAELGYSPDKEEGRTQLDVSGHNHLEQPFRKEFEKSWLSPGHEVSEQTSISPLKCPDLEDQEEDEGNRQKESRRTSIRNKPIGEHKSVGLLESPHQERSDDSKNFSKEKRRSQIKSSCPVVKKTEQSPNKTDKGKRKIKTAKPITEAKTPVCPDTVNSSSSLLSPAMLADAAVELSKETASSLQKVEQKILKRVRPSLSAVVRSFTLSNESRNVASGSTDGDDDVFEDYFSPANHHNKSRRLFPSLPVKRDIQIPFELSPVPKKRKRRSESSVSETSSMKKGKLKESQSGKNRNQQSDANTESMSHPQQDDRESVVKGRRQSTLPFMSASATTTTITDPQKKGRASSAQPTKTREDKTALKLQKNSAVDDLSHALESEFLDVILKRRIKKRHQRRGNEHSNAAGLAEIPSEVEENHNKQVSLSLQKMIDKTKMRTLVMTSMPTEKQNTVIQVVETLGGFSIVDRVCESTTHVVSGGQRRTLNVLLGIARGSWILSFEWILWCLEQRQWIPEEPYELSDQFPAAQICRLQRHLSAGEHQQDLFQDQPAMFVSQQSQPPTQSLMELIQLCGGTICKTVRQAGICIGKYSGRRPEGSRILSEQWVLDSITHLKQLSYDNYDLE